MLTRSIIIMGLFAAVATGCGRSTPTIVRETGEFETYVARFETEAARQGSPITVNAIAIRFGVMDSASDRAVCEVVGDQTPTITIKESTWKVLSEAEREQLVFHELGHCALGRVHTDRLRADGAPKSLMHSHGVVGADYEAHRSDYYRELFGN